jgi:hypothetical protein
VAATADATTQAKTARMALTVAVTSPDLPRPVALDMNGAMAFDGSRADFTMNLGSVLPTAGTNTTVETRLVGGAMYLDMAPLVSALSKSVGPLAGSLFGQVKWVKADIGALGSEGSPAQYTQYMDYLSSVAQGAVTTVGHETLRGVATTHYRATLDPSKIVALDQRRIAKMPPALRATTQKALDSLAKSRTPFVANVWIDSHDMLRRLEMDVPLPAVSAGAATAHGSVSVRMDLYDFGTVVDVQAPPASEVTDLSSLGSAVGTLGGGSSI